MDARVTHKDFRNGWDGHVRTTTTVATSSQRVSLAGMSERHVTCDQCGVSLLVRRVDEVVWQGQLVKRRREGWLRLAKGVGCEFVAPPMCVSPSLWGDVFIPLAVLGGIVALIGLFCLLMAAADLIGKPARFTMSGQGYAVTTTPKGVHTTHYVKADR